MARKRTLGKKRINKRRKTYSKMIKTGRGVKVFPVIGPYTPLEQPTDAPLEQSNTDFEKIIAQLNTFIQKIEGYDFSIETFQTMKDASFLFNKVKNRITTKISEDMERRVRNMTSPNI